MVSALLERLLSAALNCTFSKFLCQSLSSTAWSFPAMNIFSHNVTHQTFETKISGGVVGLIQCVVLIWWNCLFVALFAHTCCMNVDPWAQGEFFSLFHDSLRLNQRNIWRLSWVCWLLLKALRFLISTGLKPHVDSGSQRWECQRGREGGPSPRALLGPVGCC